MIIATDTQLAEFCSTLQQTPVIFLDTEFVGEGHYYAQLGTIQLATREQAVLIDPLGLRDLAPLHEVLTNPAIEKVFHAAGQDLTIFHRLLGQPVAPVFDTQIAAALLGYDEQISFANLVERTTGTRLQKSHCFTDWLRRPLTDGQIEYALDDVRYLVPAYERLVTELSEQGRLEWAHEEFHRLADPARYAVVDPSELYQRVRGYEKMGKKALALLRDLVAWREETARMMDIPTSRIARDEVLCELARNPRGTLRELREVRGLQQQQVERFGNLMLEVMKKTPGTAPAIGPRQSSLPPGLEPTVDFLILCLRSLASERAVSPGMVATRTDLAAIIMAGERADVPLMRGWRKKAIGDALLATLNGKATARIIPGSRRVHLDWHEGVHD
jgi:ribonuclease D